MHAHIFASSHLNRRAEEKLLTFAHYQEEILNNRRSHYGNGLSFDPLEYRTQRGVSSCCHDDWYFPAYSIGF